MNQRGAHSLHVERFGPGGGLWTAVAAVLSGIGVIVLAILFSALFLGLFVVAAVSLVVRSWLLGRRADNQPSRPRVIDAEYTVIDSGERPRPTP